MDHSLGRAYSLKSKKAIDGLFNSGRKINAFPFTLWIKEFNDSTVPSFQLVISAPKKKFKTAVERNRIKRLCKEAFRLNKLLLEDKLKQDNKQIQLFLIYIGDPEPESAFLHKKTIALFNKVIQHLDD